MSIYFNYLFLCALLHRIIYYNLWRSEWSEMIRMGRYERQEKTSHIKVAKCRDAFFATPVVRSSDPRLPRDHLTVIVVITLVICITITSIINRCVSFLVSTNHLVLHHAFNTHTGILAPIILNRGQSRSHDVKVWSGVSISSIDYSI